jgi:HK97 family phage prohead protease
MNLNNLEYKEDVTNDLEFKYNSVPIEQIEIKEDGSVAIVKGIANKVGIIDHGWDYTRSGAFDDTIKETPVVPALAFHDMRRPVGLNKLSVNKKGDLTTTMEINLDVQEGKELHSLIKQFQNSGRPMELSMGYRAKEYSFGEQDGEHVRFLDKVDVHEVSIVPFGMNQGSVITAVKKHEMEQDAENTKSLETKNNELEAKVQKLESENAKLHSEIKTIKIIGGITND